jgi:hypothetical protein
MTDAATDVAIDAVIDIIISNTQTLASFVDSNILLRIDPRLLTGEVKIEEQKRKIKRYILASALLFILK